MSSVLDGRRQVERFLFGLEVTGGGAHGPLRVLGWLQTVLQDGHSAVLGSPVISDMPVPISPVEFLRSFTRIQGVSPPSIWTEIRLSPIHQGLNREGHGIVGYKREDGTLTRVKEVAVKPLVFQYSFSSFEKRCP